MKLTRTNGGNWMKQIGIGSDYESRGVFASREQAEVALRDLIARLPPHERNRTWHIRECTAGQKLVDRLGVGLGSVCFMIGVSKKQKQVMIHASAAECEAARKTPGPCNL